MIDETLGERYHKEPQSGTAEEDGQADRAQAASRAQNRAQTMATGQSKHQTEGNEGTEQELKGHSFQQRSKGPGEPEPNPFPYLQSRDLQHRLATNGLFQSVSHSVEPTEEILNVQNDATSGRTVHANKLRHVSGKERLRVYCPAASAAPATVSPESKFEYSLRVPLC
jgi:hypothetical protein